MNSTHHNKSRIYWQCRRGMLELDDLLQGFFHRRFDELSDAEVMTFETLLRCPDALLLEYLMGHSVPLDPRMTHVVEQIRGAAH